MSKIIVIIIKLVLVILNLKVLNSANILAIYPTPAYSHQVVLQSYTKLLLNRGHKVFVITPNPIESSNPNLTQIDYGFTYKEHKKSLNFAKFKEEKVDGHYMFKWILDSQQMLADMYFPHPEMQKLLKNEENIKFDLVVIEALDYLAWQALAIKFKAPLIGITSLDTWNKVHEYMGNVFNPVLHTEMVLKSYQPQTFFERLESLDLYLWDKFYYSPKMNEITKKIMQKYLPDVKATPQEIKEAMQLLLVNVHPALGYVRPITPRTIQLGFLHIEPPKPLPNDLQNYLDNSENGVIYMSLGSNVRVADINKNALEIFLGAFQKFTDYDVLMKWEDDEMENQPKNVKIQKWFPQSDLLAHLKIKLFITQGGQQSMEEAIDRMVPVIVIPFLFDQDTNAKRLVDRNVAVHLDLHSMTVEKLESAIKEILKPKYKENMKKLREIVYDQPTTSQERAIWWTEYVLRHKTTKHLEYVGTKIPFYQMYFLDFIGIAAVVMIITIKILSFLVRRLFRKNEKLKTS